MSVKTETKTSAAQNVAQLKEEVKNLESITLIAIEHLESELSEYARENSEAIEILSVEKSHLSLSDSIKKIY